MQCSTWNGERCLNTSSLFTECGSTGLYWAVISGTSSECVDKRVRVEQKRGYVAIIIAVANQKGGVGKTTSAVSIAAELALRSLRVLLIDLDPQASASSGLRIELPPEGEDLYDVFFGKRSLSQIIVPCPTVQGLSVVPASRDLVSLELEVGKKQGRELILTSELKSISSSYDTIVIDCPPSSGLLTLNAMGAAQGVLVPLQSEYYALEGLSSLTRTIQFVKTTFNPSLELFGVFMTMFDARTNLSGQVESEASEFFKGRMFKTRIPRNIRLSECPSHGLPICVYDPSSAGGRAYQALSEELLVRLGLSAPGLGVVGNG